MKRGYLILFLVCQLVEAVVTGMVVIQQIIIMEDVLFHSV